MKFIAVQYSLEIVPTLENKQETFEADNILQAVRRWLNKIKVDNKSAYIGPCGQVVYDGVGYIWAITPVRIDLSGNELTFESGEWK